MISALLYDKEKKEMELIDTAFRDAFAMHSGESLNVLTCSDKEQLKALIKKIEIIDLSFIEAVDEEGIEQALAIRRKYPDSALLLVVSADMKPTQYIKPDIMASALIIRPAESDEVRTTMMEFVASAVKDPESDNDYLYADTEDGKVRVPFNKILYIEAREKKIYIRIQRQEYGLKETLEVIAGRLPGQFIRCHRSFIVNTDKITGYNKTKKLVFLEGNMTVPVSRTYAQMLREKL